MQSKTPLIVLLLFTFVLSTKVNAAATEPTFVGLPECQKSYIAQHPGVVEKSTEVITYCQAHMPAVNFKVDLCVEDKLKAYATENNSAVITDAIRALKTPEYKPVCTASAGSTATTDMSQYASLPGCEGLATGTMSQAQNVTCQQAISHEQQRVAAVAAKAAADKKAADDAAAAARAAQQQQRSQAGAGVIGALAPALGNMLGGGSHSNNNNGSGSTGTNGSNSTGAPGSNMNYALPRLDLNPAAPGAAPPQAAAQIPALNDAARTAAEATNTMTQTQPSLPQQLQWPADQANQSVAADQSGHTRVPRTSISQTAHQNAETLANDANTLLQQLREQLCIAADTEQAETTKYTKTLVAFEQSIGNKNATEQNVCTQSCRNPASFSTSQEIAPDNLNVADSANPATPATPATTGQQGGQSCENDLVTYNSGRAGACASDAERAEKLCVESDSMKLLKGVMDAAGPVLLGLNAAARTCGAMNNVSKFVGAGLTVANAVCIVKKNKCERSCSGLSSDFQTAMGRFEQKFVGGGQAKADYDRIKPICDAHKTAAETASRSTPPNTSLAEIETNKYRACTTRNETMYNGNFIRERVQRVSQFKQREGNPQMAGTAIAMDAKCKDKMRNIVGLASNIGAIGLAAMNAKKCEQALNTGSTASDGSVVPTVAAKDYCSADATKDTQFCKCQSSPSTTGCAPVLAAGPPAGDAPADQRGVNLKSGAGPSAFAGGGGNGGTSGPGGYTAGAGGADGAATTQANLGAVGSSLNGAGAPAGAGGGSTATGGSGSRSADAADGKKDKPDEKKWSFGTFASSLGSSLGFGGFGGGGNSGSGSNSGTESNQNRIERKIASDKFAAEVSPSTGADNFDKVKRSYVQRADSFMGP